MTPTPVPLTVLDIDSVTILKSHAFTIFLVLLILGIFIKWGLPQIIKFFNGLIELRRKDLDAEKALLQDTIKRIIEGQEKMNTAIIKELESLNISMKEVKELFVNSLKAGLKIFGVLLVLSNLVACDSDTITVYKFKPGIQVPAPVPDMPRGIDVLNEPKECNPACSPPKTKCNTKTGKCEGQSLQRSPTSDLNYLVEKYGFITPGITQLQY